MSEEGSWMLERLDEEGARRRYRIETLPCVVGRSSDCDLHLELDQVSRRHARIDQRDDSLTIEDLDSTNGTFVNARRIDGAVALSVGDTIHLAQQEFRLVHGSEDAATPERATSPPADTAEQTMVGFTGGPEGFPLLTPAFFELLNGKMFECRRRPVLGPRDRVYAYELTAFGTHPKLQVEMDALFELAGELDEGRPLAQMLRDALVAEADRAGIMEPVLLPACLAAHEDPRTWTNVMDDLQSKFPTLQLVAEVPADDDEDAETRLEGVAAIGMSGCALFRDTRGIDGSRLPHRIEFVRFSFDPDAPPDSSFIDACRARRLRMIADGIDCEAALERARELGITLVMGPHPGEAEPLEHGGG